MTDEQSEATETAAPDTRPTPSNALFQAPPTNDPDQPSDEQASKPKPTETVEFWRTKARDQEKRAKANADAADELAQIKDAQKTEAQRAADEVAAATARADEAEARVLALQIATEHKLSADDAALVAGQADEEAMRALAERLAEAAGSEGQAPVGVAVDHSTVQHSPAPNKDDAARQFFGV